MMTQRTMPTKRELITDDSMRAMRPQRFSSRFRAPGSPQDVTALFAQSMSALFDGSALPNRLLIGVSGGLDSTVLLDLAARWAAEKGIEIAIGHVNPCVDASDDDAERHVLERAEYYGCEVFAAPRPSTAKNQDAYRRQRLPALGRFAKAFGSKHLLLGQHEDDLIESFVMHWRQKKRLFGFRAMPSRGTCFGAPDIEVLRPNLAIRRESLSAYAEEHDLDWVEDLSNAALHFLRNRVRHHYLIELRKIHGPSIDDRLARIARYLTGRFDRRVESVPEFVLRCGNSSLRVDAAAQVYPRDFRLQLHDALHLVGISPRELTEARFQRLLTLRVGDSLSFAKHDFRRDASGWSIHTSVEEPEFPLLDQSFDCATGVSTDAFGPVFERVEVCITQPQAGLTLRSSRPGDRVRLPGMTGRKRLVEFMRERGVPQKLRLGWPVLEKDSSIIWVPGLDVDLRPLWPDNLKKHLTLHFCAAPTFQESPWLSQP